MKKVLLFAGKICLSILIGLVFFELAIRTGIAFFPQIMPPLHYGGAHPRGMITQDKEIGYTLTPGFQGKETNDFREYRIDVKISSQGFRDREHNTITEKFRILGLGDSFTFGEGVELKDTYLARLEEKLSGKADIIKAGVPGYNTAQEILLLKRLIPLYKPDLVILALIPQEFARLKTAYTYCQGYIVEAQKAAQLHLVCGRLYGSRSKNPLIARIDVLIKHYYYTPQFLQSRFKDFRRRLKKQSCPPAAAQTPQEKFAKTLELLKEYRDTCIAGGAKPVLLILPGETEDVRFLKNSAGNLKIPALSLLPHFEKLKNEGIAFHFRHDQHWNAAGHATCADALFDFIQPMVTGKK